MMKFPDQPTTPEQWQVIAWSCILLFAVCGFVGLYFAWNAPAGKADLAIQLRNVSLAFWGLAAGIYAVKRVVEVFCQ